MVKDAENQRGKSSPFSIKLIPEQKLYNASVSRQKRMAASIASLYKLKVDPYEWNLPQKLRLGRCHRLSIDPAVLGRKQPRNTLHDQIGRSLQFLRSQLPFFRQPERLPIHDLQVRTP